MWCLCLKWKLIELRCDKKIVSTQRTVWTAHWRKFDSHWSLIWSQFRVEYWSDGLSRSVCINDSDQRSQQQKCKEIQYSELYCMDIKKHYFRDVTLHVTDCLFSVLLIGAVMYVDFSVFKLKLSFCLLLRWVYSQQAHLLLKTSECKDLSSSRDLCPGREEPAHSVSLRPQKVSVLPLTQLQIALLMIHSSLETWKTTLWRKAARTTVQQLAVQKLKISQITAWN